MPFSTRLGGPCLRPNKVGEIKRLVKLHSVNVLGILETKVKAHKVKAIQKRFGSHWNWQDNYVFSPKGRIWLGWNADVLGVSILYVSEQLIHCSVSGKGGGFQAHFSVVYGLHTVEDRRGLWRDLRGVNTQQTPWIIAGDFNAVLSVEDRINGSLERSCQTPVWLSCKKEELGNTGRHSS